MEQETQDERRSRIYNDGMYAEQLLANPLLDRFLNDERDKVITMLESPSGESINESTEILVLYLQAIRRLKENLEGCIDQAKLQRIKDGNK